MKSALWLFAAIAFLFTALGCNNGDSPGGDDSIGALAQSTTLNSDLSEVIGKEPVVLVFYRGNW